MIRRAFAIPCLIVALVFTLQPATVRAARIELTPVIARVAPTNSQVANGDAPIVIEQSSETAYGGRLGVWLVPRVAVEASVLVASPASEIIGGGASVSMSAHMIQYDLRARVRLNDPASSTGLDLIAGLGVSDLNEPLSDIGEEQGVETPAKFTGVVGVGGTVPVSEHIRLRFDIEDHIHGSNFKLDEDFLGYSVEGRTQHDFVFAAGIVIPFSQE